MTGINAKQIIYLIAKELATAIYFILKYLPTIIIIATPYICMYTVYYCYNYRNRFAIGGEMFLPILLLYMAHILNKIKARLRIQANFPIPKERYTKDEGNGEITIKTNKQEEIILYLYDVENYLERHGLL